MSKSQNIFYDPPGPKSPVKGCNSSPNNTFDALLFSQVCPLLWEARNCPCGFVVSDSHFVRGLGDEQSTYSALIDLITPPTSRFKHISLLHYTYMHTTSFSRSCRVDDLSATVSWRRSFAGLAGCRAVRLTLAL